MNRPYLVLRTKLTPPRVPQQILVRPRIAALLARASEYRLMLVQAGTGYGKSTALAALASQEVPLAWYHLEAEDADPQVFLHHLYHSLHTAVSAADLPPLTEAPLALLEQWEQNPEVWPAVTDTIANELSALTQPLLLVIDDAHRLNIASETIRILDRFIGRLPQQLHVMLASRYPLQLPTLINWRVRGEVREIGQEALAFTRAEIAALFNDHNGVPLTTEQIDLLVARSEGWPIAIQLVWQRLQSSNLSLDEALGQLSGGDLFAYLAQEVLAQQPADIQDFLLKTAVLRRLSPQICDAIRGASDSAQILQYLQENDLFVLDVGQGHMRYHHLFRDLIYDQLEPEQEISLHQQAAIIFESQHQPDEAIYHFLAARSFASAATLLVAQGRKMVQAGRLDSLAHWIGSLPPRVLENHPPLLVYLGDIARLRSHFEAALGWYGQAATRSRILQDVPALGQALRGQARVYLDTVNPSQAERLLQEALHLSDGQADRESRARLLDLMAENMLNQGHVDKAQEFRAQARELRQEGPDVAELPARLLLRTGRLDEARTMLEAQMQTEETAPVLRPRAHRETLLILSLIEAFQGNRQAAYHLAVAGTKRGEQLASPFITAVGHMRQGHAWLLRKDNRGYEEALHCFQKAMRLSDTLDVPRLKVEASWGMCQAYGFRGDMDRARETAELGLKIAHAAGDEWVSACIHATLGAAYTLVADYEQALTWLATADTSFRNSGDNHGQTVVRLWQSVVRWRTDDVTRLQRDVADLLQRVQQHGHDFLLRRKTLLGPPDPHILIPLLIVGRDQTSQSTYAGLLLDRLNLSRLQTHPGYQLRIQMLGSFQAWRGTEVISKQQWKRKKARQLFLLLLTHRDSMLAREQIVEKLWPHLTPEHASRDFKIAYSSLLSTLEPHRPRNGPSSYILREDSRYGLRPEADIVVDTGEFTRLVKAGDAAHILGDDGRAEAAYSEALALYQGDYLEEYLYEEWCSERRERLLITYLQTAERLAQILLLGSKWQQAETVAQAILERDDCWEQAYRVLMRAYAAQGKRPQAVRVYQRCQERLRAELDVALSPATMALYQELLT